VPGMQGSDRWLWGRRKSRSDRTSESRSSFWAARGTGADCTIFANRAQLFPVIGDQLVAPWSSSRNSELSSASAPRTGTHDTSPGRGAAFGDSACRIPPLVKPVGHVFLLPDPSGTAEDTFTPHISRR
jgi:hypothetical protein